MTMKPIIAVLGATGAQGGSLVRAILADPSRRYSVRALTRNPDGAAARGLAAQGAEVVRADLDEPPSLRSAFAGAHGLFAVTNFWEHLSADREIGQARAIAEAARSAKVRHVIWSTLPDTRRRVPLHDPRMPTLKGRFKVPHFDGKGEADAFFADLPTSFLRVSFYWENFIHFGMGPRRDANGQLVLSLPLGHRPLPGIAVGDTGPCALAIFRRGDQAVGRRFGIAGEHPTGADMAGAMGRALGEPVRYEPVPFAEYARLGFPGADDLANMFQYKHDFSAEYCAAQSVEGTRELYPGVLGFAQWLARDVQRLPLPAAA